jgi:hypothetical protein
VPSREAAAKAGVEGDRDGERRGEEPATRRAGVGEQLAPGDLRPGERLGPVFEPEGVAGPLLVEEPYFVIFVE